MAFKDDVQKVIDIGNEIANDIGKMVQLAIKIRQRFADETGGEITLTTAQKTSMQTKYNTIKSELQTKFQQLP